MDFSHDILDPYQSLYSREAWMSHFQFRFFFASFTLENEQKVQLQIAHFESSNKGFSCQIVLFFKDHIASWCWVDLDMNKYLSWCALAVARGREIQELAPSS